MFSDMKVKSAFLSRIFLKITLSIMTFYISILGCNTNDSKHYPGLVGIYYSEPNLTSIKAVTVLTSLEQNWDESVDFETGSSGVWDGYIIGPADAEVGFYLETNKSVVLEIDNESKIESEKGKASLAIKMKKDQMYPIRVSFYNAGKRTDYGHFTVKWNWENNDISTIPVTHLKHSDANLDELSWLPDLEPPSVDRSHFLTVSGKNVIVYHETGRFAAWPANNGIWSWGDEILVGMFRAYYKENKYHHSVDRTKPMEFVLARSLDGGETWKIEDPDNYTGDRGEVVELQEKINFTHSDFAMKIKNDNFFTSYDRGKIWKGPYQFPDFKLGNLTSRTDVLVNGKNDAFIFLSAKDTKVKATLQDRAFCVRTNDGGKTFNFISWMADIDTIRSVMPATVRMSENHLITALRRRYDPPLDQKKMLPKNYISVHESRDNGKSWNFQSIVAETDRGIRNGNPPSMVKLDDGRIVVIYGYRNKPYSIRARISSDFGKTWSKEILLRDDGRKFDIGYTRSVIREDGKIVTVYYFTTEEKKEMHIAATIWDPDEVEEVN
jgi:hypothetical protein